MTKQEAAKKIAKLRRLARGTKSTHEAETAAAQADKLAREHGLGAGELEVGQRAAAFDDLVDEVGRAVARAPTIPAGIFDARSIIDEVLHSIKKTDEVDKASRLAQVVTVVRTAALFAGGNPTVTEIKRAIDLVLKNHDLTL